MAKYLVASHQLRCKHQGHTRLFIYPNGAPFNKATFVQQVKLQLALSGIDPEPYSGHSFRSGGSTDGAMVGLKDWELKVMGRWNSQAYHRYIRTPVSVLTQFAAKLAAGF